LNSLQKAQQKMAEMRAAGWRPERLDPIAKAYRNPTSLRMAVNGKCWDCQGAGADPGCKEAIRDCRAKDCTLWPVRPYQNLGAADEEGPDAA
jgi:hypothetical protein